MPIINCYVCHYKDINCSFSFPVYRGHVVIEHNSGKYNMFRCLIEGCSLPNTKYRSSLYIKHLKTSHGILNVADSIEVENVTIFNEPIAEIVDKHNLQENPLIDSIKNAVLVYLSKFITTEKAALELIDMVKKIFNLTGNYDEASKLDIKNLLKVNYIKENKLMEELNDDNSTTEGIINFNKRNPNNLYTINLEKDLESFINRNSAKMDFNFLNSLSNNILELTLYGDEVCVYNPLRVS
uniref:C2H2-type domain-containing protein n=1 Tax=Strongyloides venezuelensis TaxID=75913 RepID=A0A0K0FQX4_STRVS